MSYEDRLSIPPNEGIRRFMGTTARQPIERFGELARSAVAGVISDPPWQDFVHALRVAFAASHANVIFRRSDLTQAFITLSSSPDVEAFGDLATRHVPADDPIPYYAMEPFHAYLLEEFVSDGDPAEHPFIARFLQPLGMKNLLICKVIASPGMQAWISITRAERSYTAADRLALEGVAGILGEALAVFGRLKTAEDQREAYSRVVRARATGMIQLDQNGFILHQDDNVRVWIEEGLLLRSGGGRLRATQPSDRKQFDGALARILAGSSEEEFLVLTGSGETLELLIYPARERFEGAWTRGARAIIYVGIVGRQVPLPQQRLMAMLKLTRREAALAALLGNGLTLSQASAELGIADQTGRAYLRQIFQKTGVNRQSELVQRLQASIATIM